MGAHALLGSVHDTESNKYGAGVVGPWLVSDPRLETPRHHCFSSFYRNVFTISTMYRKCTRNRVIFHYSIVATVAQSASR